MFLPVSYHPGYVIPLPPRYRFPMEKFDMVYQFLQTNGYPGQVRFFRPDFPPEEWCRDVHTENYLKQLNEGTLEPKALRRIALPWSPELIRRTKIAVGGSILTARLALKYGLACNTAGGTHHAFPDYGAGYCVLNDLSITARVVQGTERVHRVLIIDLDVHQGDGTAAIFQSDPSVFTFSMHCKENFPYRK